MISHQYLRQDLVISQQSLKLLPWIQNLITSVCRRVVYTILEVFLTLRTYKLRLNAVGGTSNQQVKRQSSCSDEIQTNNTTNTYNNGNKGNVEATVGKTNLLVSSNALSNSSVLNKSFYCPSRTNKVCKKENLLNG